MVLHPSLLHSERKGIRILILGKDEKKVEVFEARTENDPEMQRIDVLSVRSLIEAERLIKRSEPLLVVYEDGFDGKDAIAIQMQLRHIDSRLLFIPVLVGLSLPTISQLQKVGNVYDYVQTHVLDDYDALKAELLDFVRRFSAKDGVLTDLLTVVNPIRHSLLAGFRGWSAIKDSSGKCIRTLLPHYDISILESASIVAADRIFIPEVTEIEYQKILGGSAPDVLEVIKASGNWHKPLRSPRSIGGFIVTVGTLMAERYAKEHSLDSTLRDIEKKHVALKHPAARVITPDVALQIESVLRGKEKKVA